MKTTATSLLTLLAALLFGTASLSAATAPSATADESALAASAASSYDMATAASFGAITSSAASSAVIVTAADLVSKVYGVLELPQTIEEVKQGVEKRMNVAPDADETGLWLDSDSGYQLSYSGMTPDMAAVAQFDDDNLSRFGYFFFFPYKTATRDDVNRAQCAFCSSLLQEMNDMGIVSGTAEDNDDSLFEVIGAYEGNMVNVMLKEQTANGRDGGRFLVILSVTPGAFTAADDMVAQN